MEEPQKDEKNQNIDPSTTADISELGELNEKLTLVKKEAEEYLNGWRRAKADLINYKKEELTRAEVVIKFSNESLLKDMITVMDSFDLATAGSAEKASPEAKGLELIKGQLEGVLRRNGLSPIVALGEFFNPQLHEAVAEEESEKPPGTVVQEISRGWKLYEKVVRATRVKVAKEKGG